MDEKSSPRVDGDGRIARLLGVECLARREARSIFWPWIVFSAMAVAFRVTFWLETHRVFDDAMIALQHAENAAQGLGLTHHASEPRTQGFSSPLGVLTLLAGEVVQQGAGLTSMRLASLAGVVLALMYLAALAAHTRLAWPFAALVMGYITMEHHQILYGMAGMETQLSTAVLLMSIYYAVTAQPIRLGIALGLCLLTRPDYIFWVIIACVAAVIRDWRASLKTVGASAAVYGPWFLFAWIYYGSPIPNTVVAKGLAFPQWWLEPGLTWLDFKRNVVERTLATFSMLAPSWNAYPFPGYRSITLIVLAAAILGAASALKKDRRSLLLLVAVWGVYTAYAVFLVPYRCPYYLVPLMATTVLLGAYGLHTALEPLYRPYALAVGGALAVAYLWCLGHVLPTTYEADRCVQNYIERDVRTLIGLHLNTVMKPDETFACEPVGYIGYYSRRTSYDWPGLTSRKVTDYLRNHPEGRSMYAVCEHFRPDYLVLRPSECEAFRNDKRGDWLDEAYRIDHKFLAARGTAPDWICDNFDAVFWVFKKK